MEADFRTIQAEENRRLDQYYCALLYLLSKKPGSELKVCSIVIYSSRIAREEDEIELKLIQAEEERDKEVRRRRLAKRKMGQR